MDTPKRASAAQSAPVKEPALNPRKLQLARLLDRTGLAPAALALRGRLRPGHIQALYYHDVPPAEASAFEAQLRWLRARYVPVGPAELDALLAGQWPHSRPGVLLSFDDGLRSHAEVVAPLLEAHGFTGWFFVPTGFVDCPTPEQATFAARHRIASRTEWPDGRLALTHDQVRALARHHVVGGHTVHHLRLGDEHAPATLAHEILGGRDRLAVLTGRPVTAFSWVGGEESTYGTQAARLIEGAGFSHVFRTLAAPILAGDSPGALHRHSVESHLPSEVFRFQLCGVMDLAYAAKRWRVARRLAPPRAR
jgi:peptidoglycan/xylan/chitin deacetylase (PgdA/CDA1 family)